jgi:hypothetical protein
VAVIASLSGRGRQQTQSKVYSSANAPRRRIAQQDHVHIDRWFGRSSQFRTYQPLRMSDMPAVDVHIVKSDQPPTGVGEPGVLPIAPTVSNAIFAATDTRLRSLPFEFNRSGDRLSSTSTREPGGERHARLGSRLSGLAFKEFLDDHRTGGSSPSKRWFRFARPRLETIVRLRHGNQDESEATTTGVVTGRLEKDNKSMRVADFGS